jgi:hypothetical protein
MGIVRTQSAEEKMRFPIGVGNDRNNKHPLVLKQVQLRSSLALTEMPKEVR